MKKMFLVVLVVGALFLGCDDADVASHNLSKAADNFEVYRRVVFYNGITDKYILSIEGYCSIQKDNADNQLAVIVKVAPGEYMKHYLGISDNVTYFAEQIKTKKVSKKRHRVTFKPSVILPSIDVR
jgi:hypothetical protein